MHVQLQASEESDTVGMRLDTALSQQVADYSRASIIRLIKNGAVTVNGSTKPPSYRLREGDSVAFDVSDVAIPAIDLPVIFENDDVIVIDKPAGVLTHSKGSLNHEATVATFIADRLTPELRSSNRGGIVHRLDRATSGVIICAKNQPTQTFLQKQFAQRKTKKTYTAIVVGAPKDPSAILNWPIARNPKKPQTFRVSALGKSASTAYKILSANEYLSLLELTPTTGRTHQLRVHMQHLGHAILGDPLYGKPDERLFLHATKLELTLPGGKRRVFSSPIPKSFADRMKRL